MKTLAVVVLDVVLVYAIALPAQQSVFGNEKVSAGSTCPPVNVPGGGPGSLYTCTGSGVLYAWTGSAWSAIAGGSGTPGSPTTSLQYNNAGAFGGISNIIWDGATLAMTETKTGGPFAGTLFVFHDNDLTFAPTSINQNGYGTRTILRTGGATQNIYSLAGFYSDIEYTSTHDVVTEVDGYLTHVNFNTSATASKVIGSSATVFSSGTATDLWGFASFNNTNNGTVSAFTEAFHAGPWRGSGTSPAEAAFYAEDYSDSAATNIYYVWLDSRGVYRIREDHTFDSVGQAIATLYNPLFTRYSAGAVNYERCIPGCQWETNVAVILNEAAGTGTLRDLRFVGANLQLGADTIVDNGKALEPDATSGHTMLIKAYDNNTGPGYVTYATVTNGNAPSLVISAPAGGATINISGLDLSAAVAPASSGTRYLCISTAGVVTSSATACSGT